MWFFLCSFYNSSNQALANQDVCLGQTIRGSVCGLVGKLTGVIKTTKSAVLILFLKEKDKLWNKLLE